MTKDFIAIIFALILFVGLVLVVFTPENLKLGMGLIFVGGIGVACLSQEEMYD